MSWCVVVKYEEGPNIRVVGLFSTEEEASEYASVYPAGYDAEEFEVEEP